MLMSSVSQNLLVQIALGSNASCHKEEEILVQGDKPQLGYFPHNLNFVILKKISHNKFFRCLTLSNERVEHPHGQPAFSHQDLWWSTESSFSIFAFVFISNPLTSPGSGNWGNDACVVTALWLIFQKYILKYLQRKQYVWNLKNNNSDRIKMGVHTNETKQAMKKFTMTVTLTFFSRN